MGIHACMYVTSYCLILAFSIIILKTSQMDLGLTGCCWLGCLYTEYYHV